MGSFQALDPLPGIRGDLGSFVYEALRAFFSRGVLSANLSRGDFQKSKKNMTKNFFQDPAAGSGIRELERKIKLFKINNIRKSIVLANKVALD